MRAARGAFIDRMIYDRGGPMTRSMKLLGSLAAAAIVLPASLAAADRPAIFAQINPGLWEVSGGEGRRQIRQCISNPRTFAQFEHRGASCTSDLVRDMPTSAQVRYSCSGGSFGTTEITVLTPRSLRIETQGISKGAPFHYVLQARRIGSC